MNTKRFPVGTKFHVVYEANHEFNYEAVVVAVDNESVTIALDHAPHKPLRCVETDYLRNHFKCEDGRFFDFRKEQAKRKPKLTHGESISVKDDFETAVDTLQSMLLDYKLKGISRKTLIANLELYVSEMKKLLSGEENDHS